MVTSEKSTPHRQDGLELLRLPVPPATERRLFCDPADGQLRLDAYEARDFRREDGGGDTTGLDLSHLRLGAVYRLTKQARPYWLATVETPAEPPDPLLATRAFLSFMSTGRHMLELAAVTEDGTNGETPNTWLVPHTNIRPTERYTLISVETKHAAALTNALAGGYYAKGTHITRASGQIAPIEHLRRGDLLQSTQGKSVTITALRRRVLRAEGILAPVVFRAGSIGNWRDLAVSPNQMLMLGRSLANTASNARHPIMAARAVNRQDICTREGGFIEYYQIVLADPNVIFAEGVQTLSTGRSRTQFAHFSLLSSRSDAPTPSDTSHRALTGS